MKKLLLLILLCCSLVLPLQKINSNIKALEEGEKPESYFTTLNGYFYQLDRKLEASPDSFEAWVKLPVSSFGGNIFTTGNGDKKIQWQIDLYGRFSFAWGNEAIHTFSQTANIADGNWHHLALVRTNTEFTYYLDGEVEGVYAANTTLNRDPIQYNIGSTNKYNDTAPLEGYVKQITIYEGAITQEQILSDMENPEINSNSETATIIGNWNLGEYWTQRFVENSVKDGAIAELHTFDKFVDADYSFGEYDYTFAIFPDIQIMTNFNPERLNNQIQWLVDHKDEMNVKFAMFLGDLSDYGQRGCDYTGPTGCLYKRAQEAMDRLNNKIPYCFVPGNHDYDNNAGTRDQVYFNTHFPHSKHSELPGFGGVYQEGSMANSYYTFDVGNGIKYLVLNLEYKPRLSVLRWANIVVEAHPDHRVIMGTHSYLTGNGEFSGAANVEKEGNGGKTIFEELMVNHSNIFLGLGGHENNDEALYRTEYGKHGNKITSMLCDVQVSKYKGEGCLDVFMLVHVNEKNKTMNFLYYSPMHNKVYNIQGQFQISFADALNPTIGE